MNEAGEQKVMNRGLVVAGAVLIQLCLGAIYAWSVFTPSLTASDAADVAAVYGAARLGLEEAKLDDMGNFPLAFTICGVLCLAAAVIIAMVRHPEKRTESAAA